MTEQEKLHRAKHYIDSLANGLNPLDGTLIPEQDVVNNVKISRCRFFVSDVLRKQLDGHEPKKVSGKDKKQFYITDFSSDSHRNTAGSWNLATFPC